MFVLKKRAESPSAIYVPVEAKYRSIQKRSKEQSPRKLPNLRYINRIRKRDINLILRFMLT